MNLKKLLLVAGGLGALLFFFLVRWTSENAGLPSGGWDYCSNLAIINAIRQGAWFPELHQTYTSLHSVSKYLPLYNGIWGSHLIVLFLTQLGLSIPSSMMLVSDVSMVCLIVVVFKLSRNRGLTPVESGLVSFLSFLNFMILVWSGFFPQLLGITFGALYFYFYGRNDSVFVRRFFFLASTFCYPEILIFVLPGQFSRIQKKDNLQKIIGLLAILIFLVLVGVLVSRLKLLGSVSMNTDFYLFTLVLFFLAIWKNKITLKSWPGSWSFPVVSVFLLATSYLIYGKFNYYSIKLSFWAPFFLVFYLSTIKFKLRQEIVGLFFILWLAHTALLPDLFQISIQQFFVPNPVITSKVEKQILSAKQELSCRSNFVIPSTSSFLDDRFNIAAMAMNSYFDGNYYFPETEIRISTEAQNLSVSVVNFYEKNQSGYFKSAILGKKSISNENFTIYCMDKISSL